MEHTQDAERNWRFRPSFFAWSSAACFALAIVFYLWSRWYADRMVANDEGWAMAFYFSPLAFLVMDGILVIGTILGIVGALVGPHWRYRAVAVTAGIACAGWFTQAPWR